MEKVSWRMLKSLSRLSKILPVPTIIKVDLAKPEMWVSMPPTPGANQSKKTGFAQPVGFRGCLMANPVELMNAGIAGKTGWCRQITDKSECHRGDGYDLVSARYDLLTSDCYQATYPLGNLSVVDPKACREHRLSSCW